MSNINSSQQQEIVLLIKELRESIDLLNETNFIFDTELPTGNGVFAKAKRFYKRLIRKSVYWFIKPYWNQQNRVNASLTNITSRLLDINVELLKSGLTSEVLEVANESVKGGVFDSNNRRVIQIVSSLNFGDAVGNDVIAIQRALKEENIVTGIFTNNIHPKIPEGTAYLAELLPELTEKDIVIYHFASEDPLVDKIKKLPAKVVLRYHNITPPEFFAPYNKEATKNTSRGLAQVKELKDFVDYGMVVSEFNKQDLLRMGYTCPMDVVPILIPFDDYKQKPDSSVIDKYTDGWTNIVFVGRVAPNKKFEDVISAYAEYKKVYNEKSRLLLVGNYDENDAYYQMLAKKIQKENIQDVHFSGHISFAAILAYYCIGDVFVCMSEHEGFCVPLVEAMYFETPIVAYNCAAIPDTLQNAGILVDKKDYTEIAKQMNNIITNNELSKSLIKNGQARLLTLSYENIKYQIMKCLENYDK